MVKRMFKKKGQTKFKKLVKKVNAIVKENTAQIFDDMKSTPAISNPGFAINGVSSAVAVWHDPIAQGTADGNRLGDELQILTMEFKYVLECGANDVVRCIVVQAFNTNGATPTIAAILQTPQITTDFAVSPYNEFFVKSSSKAHAGLSPLYKIIYDKTHSMTSSSQLQYHSKVFNLRKNKPCVYSGSAGVSADAVSGEYYIFWLSRNITTTCKWGSQMHYKP